MQATLVEGREPVNECGGVGVWSSDAMGLCTPHDAMALLLTARSYQTLCQTAQVVKEGHLIPCSHLASLSPDSALVVIQRLKHCFPATMWLDGIACRKLDARYVG